MAGDLEGHNGRNESAEIHKAEDGTEPRITDRRLDHGEYRSETVEYTQLNTFSVVDIEFCFCCCTFYVKFANIK